MTNDKMIQFVKRWRDLEARQKDLDFERSQLARDIRAEFAKGEIGDKQFINWCSTEFGLGVFAARELLLRAVAATVVPDERTWKLVGGFKAIRPLQDLSRRDQVTVLEAAKTQSKAPRTVMRERGLVPVVAVPPSPPAPTQQAPAVKRLEKHDPYLDAVVLAQFIAKTNTSIPRDIRVIMDRYRGLMKKIA